MTAFSNLLQLLTTLLLRHVGCGLTAFLICYNQPSNTLRQRAVAA
ncbi:hypothetical protein [Bartonella apis]